jgi:hypothetical protein
LIDGCAALSYNKAAVSRIAAYLGSVGCGDARVPDRPVSVIREMDIQDEIEELQRRIQLKLSIGERTDCSRLLPTWENLRQRVENLNVVRK